MATKKARNGKTLEFVTITIPNGFNAAAIADGLVASSKCIEEVEKFDTWRQVMTCFKDGLMDCGFKRFIILMGT